MNIDTIHILYGPPGAGKTTLAEQLPDHVRYVSFGNIARHEIHQGSQLGKEMQSYLDRVVEYPQDLVRRVIEQSLNTSSERIVLFDGFPKFEREVAILADLLDRGVGAVGKVLLVEIELEEALRRMSSRRICPSCAGQYGRFHESVCPKCDVELTKRTDDDEVAFIRRYNDFIENNTLIQKHLSDLGFDLIRFDAKEVSYEEFASQLN